MGEKVANHHFIPKMLLKNFTDESGKLWYFDKEKEYKAILHRHPAGIFYTKGFYDYLLSDGNRNSRLERNFGELESKSTAILEKIIRSARLGQCPNLSIKEKGLWDLFFYKQCTRVPDWSDRLLSRNEKIQLIKNAHDKIAHIFDSDIDLKLIDMHDDDTLTRICHNADIYRLIVTESGLMDVLSDCGLCIISIAKANKSFVVGSNPAAKFTYSGKSRLGVDDLEYWLPISSDVAVSPMPYAGERLINALEDYHIRHINMAIYEQSRQVASRSRRLIESLAR